MIIKHLYSCQLILNNLNEYKDVIWCTNANFGIPLDRDSVRCYILKKDSLYGVYDKNKKQIVPYSLQEAYITTSYNKKSPLIIFKQNNKVGIMNADTGEILVKPIYDQFNNHSEIYGLKNWSLISKVNKKFGRLYIKDNKIAEIKPIYDSINGDYRDPSIDINTESMFIWYLNKKKYKWNETAQKFTPYVEEKPKYNKLEPEPEFKVAREEETTFETLAPRIMEEPILQIDEVADKSDFIQGKYIVSKVDATFIIKDGQSFEDFVIKNMKYPQKAIENKIEGIIEVEIALDVQGNIIKKTIIKGLGYGCDEEALRIIKQTTHFHWKPATSSKNNKNETFTSIKRLKVIFKLPKK